jgi:hypothetical protein
LLTRLQPHQLVQWISQQKMLLLTTLKLLKLEKTRFK